jgi:hypothetical protein
LSSDHLLSGVIADYKKADTTSTARKRCAAEVTIVSSQFSVLRIYPALLAEN